VSRELSVIFIHALGFEMAELMGNTKQQRLKISENTGSEVNSPGLQAGKGKLSLVRMKSLAHLQKFLVVENDNSHPSIGVWGIAKIVGRYLNDIE